MKEREPPRKTANSILGTTQSPVGLKHKNSMTVKGLNPGFISKVG